MLALVVDDCIQIPKEFNAAHNLWMCCILMESLFYCLSQSTYCWLLTRCKRSTGCNVAANQFTRKYDCYCCCATGCHGSFWSLLCSVSQMFFKILFYGDAHMSCVVCQHTPAVFGACSEDWTECQLQLWVHVVIIHN